MFCSRCETNKAEGDFYPSALRTATGKLQNSSWCKDCTRAYYRARVATDPAYFLRHQNRSRRAKLRMLERERVARGCADCRAVHPAVLDFHHREGKDTGLLGTLSAMAASNASWKRLRVEIEKCDVLCSNCHRIRHWLERQATESIGAL